MDLQDSRRNVNTIVAPAGDRLESQGLPSVLNRAASSVVGARVECYP